VGSVSSGGSVHFGKSAHKKNLTFVVILIKTYETHAGNVSDLTKSLLHNISLTHFQKEYIE